MGNPDKISTLLTAVTGSLASATTAIAIPTDDQISTFGNLLIQAVIAIATLVRLFKKKKDE